MIVPFHLIDVPYLGVVEDLSSRDGSPNENTYPFSGMRSSLSTKCKNSIVVVCFDKLRNKKKDYNFKHKLRDIATTVHYSNIEDVPEDIINHYIEQVLFGIVSYDKEGVRDFAKYNCYEQRTMKDDESDDVIYESEMLVDGAANYTLEESLSWQKKLPYLIKRLHDKSLQTGFHVMSAIISRQKCIQSREHDTDNRKRSIQPRELISNKIFTIKPTGAIGTTVTENIADFQTSFCPWIRGDERFRDSYYDDMQELVFICERLGINLENENPLVYTGSFVESLVSDYIIENSKLSINVALQQSNGGLSPAIKAIISKLSLDELDQLPKIVKEADHHITRPSTLQCIENTIDMFFNSDLLINLGIANEHHLTNSALIEFGKQYCLYTGQVIRIRDLSYANNGFLVNRTAEYFTVNVLPFVVENQGMGTEAMIHKSGTIVLVHPYKINHSFAHTTIEILTRHLESCVIAKKGKEPIPTYHWAEVDDL